MIRLTKKCEYNYELYVKLPTVEKQEFLNKLGKFEDLEEQIGCPLEVVWKALLNGIYESYIDYENNNTVEIRHRKVRGIERFGLSVISPLSGYPDCDDLFEYKDYKKTWFLKKDKSE